MDELDLVIPTIETTGNAATMQLPDIDLYNYWNLYNNRILTVDGDITDWDYIICKSIIQINMMDKSENPKPIILLINSPGGLLNVTNSIIDTIKISRIPVWTVNMGHALSGGALLFLAGEKRFTTPNSWVMCHAGSGGFQGNFSETKEATKVWESQVKKMGEYIMGRTGMDTKTYNKYKNKDWYLNAEQQIEYGFATEIITSIDQIILGVG